MSPGILHTQASAELSICSFSISRPEASLHLDPLCPALHLPASPNPPSTLTVSVLLFHVRHLQYPAPDTETITRARKTPTKGGRDPDF